MHFCKLNDRHHLYYASLTPSYAINSLLDSQHAKGQPPHKMAMSKLISKQQANLKSSIKDINECLNSIQNCFNPTFPPFSLGSRVVDHFSSRISFYSPSSLSDEDLFYHLQNLDHVFKSSQTLFYSTTVIANGEVKKSHVATAVTYIWSDNSIIQCLQVNSINVTSVEAKLMAIHLGLIPAMDKKNIHDIIVITNSITTAKKIFESRSNPLQNIYIPVISAVNSFFRKGSRNKIQFWFCPSKAKWPKHQLIDDQVKADNCTPVFPSKESHLFSRKKECDNILHK